MDKITQSLLEKISNLHEIPNGAVSFRKNGKSEKVSSTPNIEIVKKEDVPGVDVYVHSTCQKEACHIPVIVSENNLFDVAYNDFYIEDNADVVIVAGCGVHTSADAGHNGIHCFHIGKNAKVGYVENHLAIGDIGKKTISPITKINMGEGSYMVVETTQIGGVNFSQRKTDVKLCSGAVLEVVEKILTDRFDVAKTDFKINLNGLNSKCVITSKSVAKGESEQEFKSNLVGKNSCFGRVECDAILLDSAKVVSVPKISAINKNALLSHEATVGKIAQEQLTKLMTLGLTEKQAEQKIIEAFLK